MIKIEKKNIKDKPFFYLTEQLNVNGSFKKIQVYLGKNIPNNIDNDLEVLKAKEISFVKDNIAKMYVLNDCISLNEHKKVEALRVQMKYDFWKMSDFEKEKFWRKFAISFIFESNAIEGSKLSENEVSAIVKKKYIKKSIDRKEIREVINSMEAFECIRKKDFKLSQKAIIDLHKIVVNQLNIEVGYKKKNIIVNNKQTVDSKKVKEKMSALLLWLKEQKKKKIHPFEIALDFHNRFEFIHPFSDGNGRIGRILFVWMLLKSGYGVILFKNNNRQSYFSALSQADEGRITKLYRLSLRTYKNTYYDFFV